MSDLSDFLLARIAEDEGVARAAMPGPWVSWTEGRDGRGGDDALFLALDSSGQRDFYGLSEPDRDHIARHDPTRVLAECEAKRRIVALHDEAQAADGTAYEAARDYLECTLRALALPYADHPDYREEWKP